jgi:hypothetical protein
VLGSPNVAFIIFAGESVSPKIGAWLCLAKRV